MSVAFPIVVMVLLLTLLSEPFTLSAFAVEPQQPAQYAISVDGACGKTYRAFYTITGAAINSIKADPAVLSLSVFLKGNTNSTEGADGDTTNNGTLTLTMPVELLGDNKSGLSGPVVFIDEENVEFDVSNMTEENLTIDIDFPADSKRIEIVGAYYPEYPPYFNTVEVNVEGRHFSVDTYHLPICSYEFSGEQKKLTIHSDNAAGFTFVFPIEMLGGPYSVFLDGKEQLSGIDYERRYYHDRPVSENDTTISVSMPHKRANTIEIVGTTAIPEFSSSLLLMVAATSICAILVFSRQRQFRLQK
jgi:hypothetical protein